jgi:predicted amidohydrolase
VRVYHVVVCIDGGGFVFSRALCDRCGEREHAEHAMSRPNLIAVGQMTSGDDVDKNLDACARLCRAAKERHASLLVLPENFAFLGRGDGDTLARMEPLDGPLFSRFRALARDHGLWVSFGGFPERASDTHAHNAHVVVDDAGDIRAVYRKIHLFDVELGVSQYRESAAITPGRDVVVADSVIGRLGLSVCYDLRFPRLYQTMTARGAEVLLVPAAFTLLTGKEHWEPLLRARAIENECYVAAAAQTGRHNDKRDTYGHAMIIDPWGTVVAQCRDGEGVAVADVDVDWIATVRRRIPVLQHRRDELY